MSPTGPLRTRTRATPEARAQAQSLRHDMQILERAMWKHLRGSQQHGLRFHRQHPLGPFIADFYCHEATLVIEVDGEWAHGPRRRSADERRDHWMRERGLSVLRIGAWRVHHCATTAARYVGSVALRCVAAKGEMKRHPLRRTVLLDAELPIDGRAPSAAGAAPPPLGAGEEASHDKVLSSSCSSP